jgi:hypothetical protein
MKLRLIALFSLLLIAAVTAWAVSNSILYQLPSVAATPVCQVTGGTNTRFLTGSGVSALVAYPVDPCVGGPTVGTVTLGN